MKAPKRKEALIEFSKYARAHVEQVRQTEKVRCNCEQHDKSSHFPLPGCCRCEGTHHELQGFATTLNESKATEVSRIHRLTCPIQH